MTTLLWVLGLSLGVSFLCSILEAVLLSVNQGYIQVLRDEGRKSGEFLHHMQQRIDEPISAILTLNTIAHTMGAALGGGLALQLFGDEWIALFSAGLTLAILLASEIIPKTLGATHWKRLAPATAWFLRILVLVMRPVLIPLSVFSRMISRERAQQSTISRAELEVLAEIGRREGTLDEAEWRVVTNVMNLSEVTAGAVMTPRTDMVAVPVDATVAEAKDVMLDEGHLRVPVYDEDRLDRIVGILLARDLWQADRSGVTHIRDIVRPVLYTPASKPVEDLLFEMRRSRTKMAMVVDEFGGIAGLATLEDLIEEIVGEIQDEHESDEPPAFQPVGRGVIRVWGGVSMREAREHLGLDLPETEHETLGGFVFGALNRVPRVGDEIEVDGSRLRVVRMEGRRIRFLRVYPRAAESQDPAGETPLDPSTEAAPDPVPES
ncbi:MAG: HlyC/CorC family transporter [Gemmatimonadales bacterium]|nr:MAG: HlyC/CorC family transporter [Gemmatimonadales bacterium]